jgi:uncharacterized delta-60 repeat protein
VNPSNLAGPILGTACALAGAWTDALAGDGSLDPGFGTDGVSYVVTDDVGAREITPLAAVQLPDGKLLFGGTRNKILDGFPEYEPQIRGALVRLDADGSADASFGNTTIPGLVELPDLAETRMQGIESMVVLADGSIVAVGTSMVSGPLAGTVVKLHADGSLDSGFGDAGAVLVPDMHLHAVGVDSQGRIVTAGERVDVDTYVNTSTVLRFGPDGTPDVAFGSDGNGAVPIAWTDPALSGYLDAVAIGPDDQMTVAGAFEAYGAGFGSDFAIARLNAGGGFDPAYGDGGWRVFHDEAETSNSNWIHRLVLEPDGSVVFAGAHTAGENLTGLVLGRLDAHGFSDDSFGGSLTPGYFIPPVLPEAQTVNVTALVQQGDGKLLVSAGYYVFPDPERFFVMRASADGRMDSGFADGGVMQFDAAPGGVYSEAGAMALEADGRIVVAGRAQRTSGSPLVDFAAIRLENSIVPADRIFAGSFE